MMGLLGSLEIIFEEGFIYAVLAMGAYISYCIMDFPDLTVEGTFLSGGVTFALLARVNVNPWLAMVAAFAVGMLGGAVTGFIHSRFKLQPVLCGLAVGSALVALNLITTVACMGGDLSREGLSVISLGKNASNIFRALPFNFIPYVIFGIDLRKLCIVFIIAVVLKLISDCYFRTRQGLLVRASGRAPELVIGSGCNPANYKIIGLAVANGFATLAGTLSVQAQGNANQSIGSGMVVIGLTCVMLGLHIFRCVGFMRDTTRVILGALVFRLCIGLAELAGVPGTFVKLITAVLFFAALIISRGYMKNKKLRRRLNG